MFLFTLTRIQIPCHVVSRDIFTLNIVHSACAIYRLAMKAFITMYKISGPTRSMIDQLPGLIKLRMQTRL